MKISIKIMVVILLCSIFFMYMNTTISYADNINLKSYVDRIFEENERLNEHYFMVDSVYAAQHKSDDVDGSLAVRYEWLHAVDEMIKLINSDKVSYRDIANNSEDDINSAINALSKCRTYIGTFTGKEGKFDDGTDTFENDRLLRQGVALRSGKAFETITKYKATTSGRKSYDNYIGKAIRELNASYDYARGKSNYKTSDGYSVNINDNYNIKFKYTYKQIELYKNKVYGERYNCDNSDIIKKVWNYKVGVYKTDNTNSIITRKDLYVDKNDKIEVKAEYDKDKKTIYLVAFGQDEFTKMCYDVEQYRSNGVSKKTLEDFKKENQTLINNTEQLVTEGADYSKEHQNDFNEKYSNVEYDEEMMDGMYDGDTPGTEYNHPKVSKTTETMDIDKTIEDSENFIKTDDENSNNNIDSQQLSDFFNPIYNVALIIGIIVSVIVGAILGIKFMTGSVEQKADTKKLLIPYVAGCIAVFGAFFIWKLVVTIMAGL